MCNVVLLILYSLLCMPLLNIVSDREVFLCFTIIILHHTYNNNNIIIIINCTDPCEIYMFLHD